MTDPRQLDSEISIPSQLLALIDCMDQCIGVKLPLSRDPRPPRIQTSEAIRLVVWLELRCVCYRIKPRCFKNQYLEDK